MSNPHDPKCPKCYTRMRPLFTTFFCPNECDRPERKKPTVDDGWDDVTPLGWAPTPPTCPKCSVPAFSYRSPFTGGNSWYCSQCWQNLGKAP